MERLGFIHEKLDMKILILYVLQRLPEAVPEATLAELCLFDDGISYFEYAECLAELVDTQHVEKLPEGYKITEKGRRNGSIIESSLPYSVRAHASQGLRGVAAAMRRDAMIVTRHTDTDSGCMVELGLSDGIGEIMSLHLLTTGEAQAKRMEGLFRADAEGFYHKIIGLFAEEEQA